MSRTRVIAVVIAGASVVLILAVAGASWREIYYALRPEARFWGWWEVEGHEESESDPKLQLVGFREDGNVVAIRFVPAPARLG